MKTALRKMGLLAGVVGILGGLTGCQWDTHQENVQLAQARWSRARASVTLQLAEQQYKAGQLDKALVTVGQAIALDPSFPRLQTLRGRILAEKGQGQQAIAAFEIAIAMDARDPVAYYQCGVQHEKWAQFDNALARYQSAFALAPANLTYAVAIAETLGQLNRAAEALELIDRLLAGQQQSIALRVTAGELCQAQGDYDRAAGYFREAARLATDDTAVLRSLAMALYRAGRHEEACGYLEQLVNQRAAAAPPGPVRSASGSAGASSPTDPAGAADRQAAEAARAAAERGEVLLALGDCYLADNRPQLARDCFVELTRLLPRQPSGWESLAKVALHQRHWDEAIASADKALELVPNSASGCLVRGYALLQQGKAGEAVWAFQRAHRMAPKDVLMLCLLADSYRRLGEGNNARDALVRAVQIAPDDPLANRMMNELARAQFGPPAGQAGRNEPGDDGRPLAPPTVTAGVRVPE